MATREKTHFGKFMLIVILTGTVLYSYFNSREMYSYWMRTYYETVRGQSEEEQVRTARKMYDLKKYRQVVEYLRSVIIAYPENRELQKINGQALLKLGESPGGTDAILSATDGEVMPEKLLEETVQALYENRRYRDILALFKKNRPGDNPNLLYHYGMSQYYSGNYPGAIALLRKAIDKGRTDRNTYHYLALAYDKTGNTRMALPLLERAFEMNENDRDVARSLAAAYRKTGRLQEAAKILRKTQ